MIVQELPLFEGGPEPRVRADAARNRARILEAASALVGEVGIEHVSMEDVAKAACVGTGTLYRRFGDRAGLALALLDSETREFQNEVIAGPPPLGPGAPARERLHAFGSGYMDLLESHSALMAAAGPPNGGGGTGPHVLATTHLRLLLEDAAPEVDAPFAAEALMAMLAPAHFLRLRHDVGWPLERCVEGWCALVDALTRS